MATGGHRYWLQVETVELGLDVCADEVTQTNTVGVWVEAEQRADGRRDALFGVHAKHDVATLGIGERGDAGQKLSFGLGRRVVDFPFEFDGLAFTHERSNERG